MNKEIEKVLINKFGINEIKKISKIRGAYKVETANDSYCYKESYYGEEVIMFVFDILKKLSGRGYVNIPRYIKTLDNKEYYMEENKICTLSKWIPSHRINFENEKDILNFTDVLCNFHFKSKGVINIPKRRQHYGNWITNFERKIREIYLFEEIIQSKKDDEVSEFDILFLKKMKVMIKDSIKSIEELYKTNYYEKSKAAKLEGQVCHHDLEYHNIIIDDNGKYYLIDFDYAIGDIVHHDIASLINRISRKRGYEKCDETESYRCIFKKYIFDEDDRNIVSELIRFSEEFWQVGYQYYIEKQKWTEDKFIRRLNRAIEVREGKINLIKAIKN